MVSPFGSAIKADPKIEKTKPNTKQIANPWIRVDQLKVAAELICKEDIIRYDKICTSGVAMLTLCQSIWWPDLSGESLFFVVTIVGVVATERSTQFVHQLRPDPMFFECSEVLLRGRLSRWWYEWWLSSSEISSTNAPKRQLRCKYRLNSCLLSSA